jgi:hypothetical protein
MSVTLYDAAIPALTLGLTNLLGILDKGAQHAAAKKTDARFYVAARLIADMHPLARQVQIACDTAKGAAARLAGIEPPRHEDNETTVDELKERIRKTIEFIGGIDRAKFSDDDGREIVMKFPNRTTTFSARDYVSKFVLPNFYFHVTMSYAVLRANGVDVGKSDFLGGTL